MTDHAITANTARNAKATTNLMHVKNGESNIIDQTTNNKPIPHVIIGLGLGDEGKGMAVAHETRRIINTDLDPVVVRFNGGAQAAHNVRVSMPDGRIAHHTHAQYGSGAMLGARTILTNGMLVDPLAIIPEAEHLAQVTGDYSICGSLAIDENAPVLVPLFAHINQALEEARGNARHGSTGRGVGIARTCEAAVRSGEIAPDHLLTFGSLTMPVEDTAERLAFWAKFCQNHFGDGAQLPDYDPMSEAERLHDATLLVLLGMGVDLLEDSWAKVRSLYDDGHTMLVFEGSQGVLLDERYGWFPHVTYGDMTQANVMTNLSGRVTRTLGVTRCYSTRHGAGPLPTEGTFHACERDNVTERWTGGFRTGLLDLPDLAVAASAIRPDEVALTCLDRYPGRVVTRFGGEVDAGCRRAVPTEPVIEDMDVHALMNAIEGACGAIVSMVGASDVLDGWHDR